MDALLKWAEEHPSGSIVLDGNADSIGAATYNVRLSARRAESVRDRLIQLGVDEDRIVVAIYGEDGLRRTENALDRRVTIWTTHDPIYAIVDSTLVRGKAVLWSRPVTYAELHPNLPEEVAKGRNHHGSHGICGRGAVRSNLAERDVRK